MRLAPFALCLLTFAATAQEAPADKPEGRKNQKIERIHVEDSGSKVDELRVGGQTQQIVVQPKARVPAYEIRPKDGQRVWNVLGF
jgi:hypothetical protein